MDYLWTPWRKKYMQTKKSSSECIFCFAAQHPNEDETTLVVYRGEACFVILNRYPYTSGHLMVVPYLHLSKVQELSKPAAAEMMYLAQRAESVLQSVYNPNGLNMGINVGAAAGAGIAQHLHMHVLPRWDGDANFMTTIGNARIIPEALEETFRKVHQGFLLDPEHSDSQLETD
jgi:ATP adenylyltransferase